MITIIEKNDQIGYAVYRSSYIKEKQKQLLVDSRIAYNRYQKYFNKSNLSSTWGYYNYNIFSLAGKSLHYYNLYKDLRLAIQDFVTDKKADSVWISSWLNLHKQDELKELDWHTHLGHSHSTYHGYISIDPKVTVTEFKSYAITNEIGNIYIGPTGLDFEHRVNLKEPFNGHRVTVAFDLLLDSFSLLEPENDSYPNLIPMIL